ncbi:hypothetical protein N7470_007354 [Penicillium chermesinum]|nr:hypothetical protein N7470_007354 [Penicillium chermesinum]
MASLGEDLLVTVNKLQDLVFNTIGNDSLDLPQIVVVGSQSSGKSSVLENIVGRDFLPRGSGIVTRRPLILQLINIPSERDDRPANDEIHVPHTAASVDGQHEWAEFHHQPGRKFEDFAQVKQEIEAETARIADIEKQTRTLILEYIAKPNSIILAVSPANVDLVNSEALKLARQVDPMGRRTIGVLSKLDLMDHGTNAMDILSGRVYPLKLGFIGVVNRSQQDIQSGKSLADALRAESDFFRHHPAYRNMATRYRLPDIKARLNTLMGQTQQELASYGNKQFSGKEHRGSLILQLMTRFASSFISSIDGTSSEISTKELCGGARIYYIFNEVFGNSLETIDPTHNLTVSDIRTAIRNSTGPRASLFVPELAFDLLVKPQIKLLEAPAQRCVELVYEELIKICHTCGSQELLRFPRLQGKLIEVVSDLLRERLGPCSGYVESLISIQRAYINTNHPNFPGAAAAMQSIIQSRQEEERKALQAEEKRKREKRRLKELGTANGAPAEDEEGPSESKSNNLPLRSQSTKGHRSMSPHVGRHAENGIAATLNGVHASQPAGFGSVQGSTRDSFLNYFFGKEGVQNTPAPQPALHRSNHTNEHSPSQAIRRAEPHENVEPTLTDKEMLETELIRRLISSYFAIVRETIADQVPKAIMHLLVNHSKDVVQNRLVSELYKEDLFGELLYEDDGIKAEREKCERLLDTYKEAAKIVGEVL